MDGPDQDSDGFVDLGVGGDDCNDTDASVNPNAPDIPETESIKTVMVLMPPRPYKMITPLRVNTHLLYQMV